MSPIFALIILSHLVAPVGKNSTASTCGKRQKDVILVSGVMIAGGFLMMPANPLIGSGLLNSGMTMGSKALGSYLSGGKVTYTTAEYFKTGVAGFASGSISAGIAQYGISIGLTGVGNSAFAAVGDMSGNAAAQKILSGQVDTREMIVSGATSFVCESICEPRQTP